MTKLAATIKYMGNSYEVHENFAFLQTIFDIA